MLLFRCLLPSGWLSPMALAALALAMITAATLAATPADAVETGREFTYQNWSGNSYLDDDTNRFSHCAVAAEYQSDISLAFALDRDHDLALALSHGDWQIPADGLGEIMLVLDGAIIGQYAVSRVTENSIGIWFSEAAPYMEALRKGTNLEVRAERETFYFELAGTHRALSMLEDCVRYELSLEAGLERNPFGDENDSFGDGGRPPADNGMAGDAGFSQGMKSMLQDAGFTDVRMMSEGAEVAFDDAVAAWTQETYTGGLYLFDLEGTNPNEVLDRALEEGQGSCVDLNGHYVAGSDEGVVMGSVGIREGQGICRYAENTGSFFHISVIVDGTSVISILQYYVFYDEGGSEQIIDSARRVGPIMAALLNE